MPDSDIKTMAAGIDTPVFDPVAFNRPPDLAEATVALVTTAALHHADQDDFAPNDISYRELSSGSGAGGDLRLGHWSPNFDVSGFAADPNVVFPIDRLRELAERGRIGRVSDVHLSFAGNQFELNEVRYDSGPAGAKRLIDAGVDVVLLTPV